MNELVFSNRTRAVLPEVPLSHDEEHKPSSATPRDVLAEQNNNVDYEIPVFSESQINLSKQLERLLPLASEAYRIGISNALAEYHHKEPDILTAEIMGKIELRGYLDPQFKILDPSQAEDWLENQANRAYRGRVRLGQPDSLVLTFNPGKPFARYWYKGKRDGTEKEIPWGYFCYAGIQALRDFLEKEKNEEDTFGKVKLNRMNDLNGHDWRHFHYIWEVRPSKEKLPDRYSFPHSTEGVENTYKAKKILDPVKIESEYSEALFHKANRIIPTVSVENFEISTNVLIEMAKKYMPATVEKIDQLRIAHGELPLAELPENQVLDYLFGVDKVLKVGSKLYFVDMTIAKNTKAALKVQKLASRENLYRSLGADGAVLLSWRRGEEPTEEDAFNFLWSLEEASSFVVDVRFLE